MSETLTGWIKTDSLNVKCPKCQAECGEFCRTPKGCKYSDVHKERSDELIRIYGLERFKVKIRGGLKNEKLYL